MPYIYTWIDINLNVSFLSYALNYENDIILLQLRKISFLSNKYKVEKSYFSETN